MSEIKVFCPSCNQKIAVDAEYIGFEAQCPNCMNCFVITVEKDSPEIPQPAIQKPAIQRPQSHNSSHTNDWDKPQGQMPSKSAKGQKSLQQMKPAERDAFYKKMRKYFSALNASGKTGIFAFIKRLFVGNNGQLADKQMEAELDYFRQEANTILGIDKDEISFSEPVSFASYALDTLSSPRNINDPYIDLAFDIESKKQGKSTWRAPIIDLVYIAFSEHCLHVVSKTISLVSESKRHFSREYFYTDIVNIEVEHIELQTRMKLSGIMKYIITFILNILREIPIIKWFVPKRKESMKIFDYAGIEVTSGSNIKFFVPVVQVKQIMAMKNLIKQRKMSL